MHLQIATCLSLLVAWANVASAQAAQRAPIGKFNGPGGCASSSCHGSILPKTVTRIPQNEYSIWAGQDKHARAYQVLSNDVSVRMGKILGLKTPPSENQKCLACHALAVAPEQRAQSFEIDDGVSCENCHGPGSAHAAAEAGDTKATAAELASLRASMRLPLANSVAEKRCLES